MEIQVFTYENSVAKWFVDRSAPHYVEVHVDKALTTTQSEDLIDAISDTIDKWLRSTKPF